MADMLYNLIVRYDESQAMPKDRMFEGTDPEIRSRFIAGETPNLQALSQYPTILTREFAEDDATAQAVIGYMNAPSLNPQISNPVLRFPSTALLNCGVLGKWRNTRTCWTVLRGDPYKLFSTVSAPPCQATDNTITVDDHLIAVMMPFADDPEIDPVFLSIKEGAESAGFECKRVDQLRTPTDITEDIRELICKSHAVIADISNMNPNVLYELGFAHGKGKRTVLLSNDSLGKLPFDISHQRIFQYTRSKSDLEKLSGILSEALASISKL